VARRPRGRHAHGTQRRRVLVVVSPLASIFSKTGLGTLFQLAGLGALAVLAAVSTDQVLRVRRVLREADAAKPRRPYQYRAVRAKRRVLIVGDSTGVGIGAECATQSIAGLFSAEYRGAEVVNVSVSGSTLGDVPAQLCSLGNTDTCFDVVLLHVGGNDILRSPNLTAIQQAANSLLPKLHRLGRRVIWIGPGDVGLAPLFRPPFSWWLSRRSRQACALFERVAAAHQVEFVGFHGDPHRDVLVRDRHLFFASDGFHPNSHGYRYCYGWLSQTVARQPLLVQRHRAVSHPGAPIKRWPADTLPSPAAIAADAIQVRAHPVTD
jgi:lysophospholipase L1-like esterase